MPYDETTPRREDYPDTPRGLHMWAQAMQRWNAMAGVKSDDLVKQWDESRRKQ